MQYAIKAFRRLEPVSLTLDAVDVAEARRQAEQQGLTVVEVREPAWWLRLGARSGGRNFPLLQFSQSLLILLDAGLSVVEAIETLAERETRADIKRVLSELHGHLGEGLALSVALERQPEVFPPLYVASIRANERTGTLAEAIKRFILYRSQSETMRKRVIGAYIYPLMIVGVGVLVIAFLLAYVVPRFSLVFQDLGDRIPYLSRLLLDWGRFVHEHGVELLLGSMLLAGLAAYALAQPSVRTAIARGIQRIPRIGEYVRVYQLARFYRALGMLQQAGIPILTALDMVVGLLPSALHAGLRQARRDIAEGVTISAAFEAHGLTTAVSLRLLRVAERTGQMGELLQHTAAFHDEEVAQAIDWFLRLFEPLLMIAIGIVIGIVVLLMYAPIFELAGSLQ
jgi:general secretion pathway protein F